MRHVHAQLSTVWQPGEQKVGSNHSGAWIMTHVSPRKSFNSFLIFSSCSDSSSHKSDLSSHTSESTCTLWHGKRGTSIHRARPVMPLHLCTSRYSSPLSLAKLRSPVAVTAWLSCSFTLRACGNT